MPKIVDERARKELIAEAVWAVATEEGLPAATMRAVAARCGLSVGAIQHSFPSQAGLQRFAMELIVERVTARIACAAQAESGDSLEAVARLLEQLLPLDGERMTEARVWSMFSTMALTDESLRAYAEEMQRTMEGFCRDCLAHLVAAGFIGKGADLLREASALQALLDGLTLHLLLDPGRSQSRDAVEALRSFLTSLQ